MNVIMPQLGETVAEGKVASWFKKVGDMVAAGDNLFLIETDKVSMEVQATEAGTLTEIRVPAGETVPVGTVVGILGKAGEQVTPAKPAPARPAASVTKSAPAPVVAAAVSAPAGTYRPFTPTPFEEVRTPVGIASAPAVALDGLKTTPLARRLIQNTGADLAAIARQVKARGGWRIAAADVAAAPAAPAIARTPIAPREGDTIEPLNRIRAQTAANLAEAWRTIPHAFQAVELDVTGIAAARDQAKATFEQRHGVALTYLPFIARALCIALGQFPRANASFDRDRLILHRDINLGIATDLEQDGLVVPVVQQAEDLTVAGLAKAIARLADRARSGKLTPADLAGATYTLTNNGSFGTQFTMPVINPPNVAILSFDAVRKAPVVVEGPKGDNIAIRRVAMIGQSFDHRAFDGSYAGSLLRQIKEIVETRDWAAELG
ncbi:MAG TPA: dihydrolipoamide acetyltransferase family protein [Stellaceae bacterium]|nr:dihydrolipoamide acetyltransferase family protein [Stellaceae bacterium]